MKKRALIAALSTGVCAVAMATPAQAQVTSAQAQPLHFQIPAGTLKAAIDAYTRRTGRQVIYRADEIGGARSTGVQGAMPVDAALVRLLRGSGFTYRADNTGAIAIIREDARDGGAVIGAATPPAPMDAQTADASGGDDIVVTGIRASLQRSIDIKRNSFGVVDAISAEDIGKFPDTNLAESLQRITGVSIDRTNGEGSLVTVRGFGPAFNLVTLNGRTLATSIVQVVGADGLGDDAVGTSRSFDFSNLASEGVRTLEVYKTGRAAVPSGGIGATINVVTRHPLDNRADDLTGSFGVKGVYDASVSDCIDCGAKVTPELSGVLSWKDPSERIGVALFGSYQKRNFTSVAAQSNNWNIVPFSTFATAGNYVRAGGICPPGTTALQPGCTIVQNAPTNGSQLVAIPDDSSYQYAEGSRTRMNGQAVIQFRPTDTLTFTADGLFAQNRQQEVRSSQQVWFARPFDEVRFVADGPVRTATYLHETTPNLKDVGFEEQNRAQKSKLTDFGLNAKWDIASNFTMTVDGHISDASSRPDNPNGYSSTRVGVGAIVVAEHSVDYSGEIPKQSFSLGNRPLDLTTIGSTIARLSASTQTQKVREARVDFGWDLGKGSRFDFGADYRTSETRQLVRGQNQTLGDWGLSNPGDIERIAPGALKAVCLVCRFDHYDPGNDPNSQIAYRGNAATVFSALSPYYLANGNRISDTSNINNRVKEDIWAIYGQLTWKGEIAGRTASLVTGARFERTTTTSTSIQAIPSEILWRGGDFNINISSSNNALVDKGRYTNLLPSMDFQIEAADNLIGRFSASRTIARPNYGDLFSATQIVSPAITAIGQIPTASTGNAGLQPLTSDNFDVSLEYYYKPGSFVSIGFFDKRVHNFIGNGQFTSSLFGLRNATSGEPGTTSGTAKALLQGQGYDVSGSNLFVMSALLQQRGSANAALAEFAANYNVAARALNSDYALGIQSMYDVAASPNDPLYQFQITRPINNRDAELYGLEIAGQHFFGTTGFGVAASYTLVRGDVGYDNGADPNADQFALLGLSDTANATLIFDKYGLSARLAYNWRGTFLSSTNRAPYHSPVYNKPFGQVDMNVSYDVTRDIAVSFEAINLTRESVRTYGRDTNQLWYAQELNRRFMLGARYKF
jgi:TonB-dependent receptor